MTDDEFKAALIGALGHIGDGLHHIADATHRIADAKEAENKALASEVGDLDEDQSLSDPPPRTYLSGRPIR